MKHLNGIDSVFLILCEVSARKVVKRLLSLHMCGSNVKIDYILTGLWKNQNILNKMDRNDANVYGTNILDLKTEQISLKKFFFQISEKVDVMYETDDVRRYIHPKSKKIKQI